MLRCEVAEVRTLEVHDAGILTKRAAQLAVPGIDGVDAGRAAFEEHGGEAARRGAEVDRDPRADVDGEAFERRLELGAPAQPGFGFDHDLRGEIHAGTRVEHRLAVFQHGNLG